MAAVSWAFLKCILRKSCKDKWSLKLDDKKLFDIRTFDGITFVEGHYQPCSPKTNSEVKANIDEFKKCYARNSTLSSIKLIDHFLAEKVRTHGLCYGKNLPSQQMLRRLTSNWSNEDRKKMRNEPKSEQFPAIPEMMTHMKFGLKIFFS